ncbi:MAG: nicotinate (nicotinamide) nucleotide adenylyltransferase [bacterium]
MTRVVGILGGTFDPPHAGHIAAATAAGKQMKMDEVRVIPAGLAPLRAALPLASATDRLAMVKLAFEPCPWAVIDDREVKREGVCWSVDTARELARDFPKVRRVWIIGADQLARLDRWKDIDELSTLVEFAVLSRDGISVVPPSSIAAKLKLTVLRAPPVKVSSTALRLALQERKPSGNGLPKSVRDFIEEHSLYTK